MMGTLKNIWTKWLVVSEIIGDIVSAVVLTAAYLTIFLIPCLFFTFIIDVMGKKYQNGSYFQKIPVSNDCEDLEDM